jgi:hypothetical protein
LLKVDVEGAEQAVFDGLSDENLARVRQIVTEVSADKKAWIPALEARLERAGFDRVAVTSSFPGGGDPRRDAFVCNVYALRTAGP